jgi:hypothetical protein
LTRLGFKAIKRRTTKRTERKENNKNPFGPQTEMVKEKMGVFFFFFLVHERKRRAPFRSLPSPLLFSSSTFVVGCWLFAFNCWAPSRFVLERERRRKKGAALGLETREREPFQ